LLLAAEVPPPILTSTPSGTWMVMVIVFMADLLTGLGW
jgi:hypothetical protein